MLQTRRGAHRAPVLMKLSVLCVCYDVMKIVYPNVAAFSERQSFWLQNQNEQICMQNCYFNQLHRR